MSMVVTVWAARSITVARCWERCTILSPFTETVLWTGSRACLEKTPTTFIMLNIAPPVIVVVSR
jgi:hypothetical protein